MKRWLARLTLMLLVPLACLTLLEFGLRLGGYGYSPRFFISGPKTSAVVSNPLFTRRFFPGQITRAPLPLVLEREKPRDTCRVFVFGASAALGDPDASAGFARILEAMLNLHFPDRRFEVVNAAMTAINSHVVLPIARECAAHAPDLYIVYLGNNEVIGPYGLGTTVAGMPPALPLVRAGIRARSLRIGQLAGGLSALAGGETTPQKWSGMRMFLEQKAAPSDPRLEHVYANFRSNLRNIVKAGQQAGAGVLLCTVLTNLKDCPPFRSEHRQGLPPEELQAWEAEWDLGNDRFPEDPDGALLHYDRAAAIDDRFALLEYRRGMCCLAMGRHEQARRFLRLARDLDVFRFRADTRINDIIRSVAGETDPKNVTLVDLTHNRSADTAWPNDIPGEEWLHDHVHMTFAGNYAIAAALFPAVVKHLSSRNPAVSADNVPSQDTCAAWLVYTSFSRFQAAKSMASRMANPPFSQTQARKAEAVMKRRLAALTPALLRQYIEQSRAVLRQRPDDLFVRANMANMLYVLQDNEVAVAEYGRLLDAYPYASDWQYFMGDALAAMGRTEDAELWLREALDQEPANSEARRALAYLFLQTGRGDAAMEQYETAIATDPAFVRARSELGQLMLNRGEPLRAEHEFREALRRAPEQAQLHLFLGLALAQQNHVDAAIKAFEEAARLNPNSGTTHYNLARMYDRAGKVEKARTHYRRAAELDPAFR